MDLPVLRYLDILIGVSVVMLLACTVATAATQFLLSTTYSRARYLRDAMKDMVEQIDPELLGTEARYIAERMLRHPLASRNATLFGRLTGRARNRLREALRKRWPEKLPLPRLNPAEVLQRDEIVQFLLEWADENSALAHQDRQLADGDENLGARLDQLRDNIRRALARAGIADPAVAARCIRERIVAHEKCDPAAPAQLWRTRAIAEAAVGDLSGKVFTWFDNTMARVSENFALEAKVVASVVALLLCFLIQLDAISLIRKLAADDKYRQSLVDLGSALAKQSEQMQAAQKNTEAGKAQALSVQIRSAVEKLDDPGLEIVPPYVLGSGADWEGFKKSFAWKKVPGILLSWVLVSLGAPFWYDLLKKLLGFRSLLARKDDEDRKQRVEQQAPPPGAKPEPAPPSPASTGAANVASGQDERGDLGLTGAAG
jgi:hypothetical protein